MAGQNIRLLIFGRMNIYDRYEVSVGEAKMVFEFQSEGPRGTVTKVILFTRTVVENLYNLGFGDKDETTGDLHDTRITNNGDSLKVLATVASTVYTFTETYPQAMVLATGSTASRTRLYRIGLSNNLEAISQDFYVFGFCNNAWEVFEKDRMYEAFYVMRKL